MAGKKGGGRSGGGGGRKPGHYPVAEDISYIAEIDGHRSFFLTDEPYSREWFYPRYRHGRLHEPAATRYLAASLTPESVFVDVGAHLGYFSVIAAARAREVFAIEAQEFLISRIHRNAVANHLTNLNILHCAAADVPGFLRMPKQGTASSFVGTDEGTDEGALVPAIRLDDYFAGTFRPTHIKIDTEGFEYQVLLGAQRVLETRPTLIIELHKGMHRFGYGIEDLYALLTSSGYRLKAGKHRAGQGLKEVDLAAAQQMDNAMVFCEPR